MSGCVWSTCTRVKVDYSEYLGKDYVYRYDKCGIQVSNHLSVMDVPHCLYLDECSKSFMGKKESMEKPLIGRLVRPFDSVMVARDTRDAADRKAAINAILVRAEAGEKGERPPLMIWPEGCSTNGEYVVSFKKGAFTHLRPVKPFSCKTWSIGGVSPNDAGGMSLFALINLSIGSIWGFDIKEMPVFEPNEYFWKHHWDGKEPKWEAYARVV